MPATPTIATVNVNLPGSESMTMFKLNALLAVEGADEILTNAIRTSQQTGEAWNKQWDTIFQSGLYYGIVTFAGVIAAGSLIFFMLQFMRAVMGDEDWQQALESLLLPIAVVVILANHGAILANSTALMRTVIHQQANNVLQIEFTQVKLQDAIQTVLHGQAIATELRTQLSQCYGMVGQKQIDCLQDLNTQIQKTIDAQPVQRIKLPAFFGTIQRAIERIVNTPPTSANNNPADGLWQTLGGAAGAGSQDIATNLLLAWGWAFANCLEMALLLNALMGPIAVAGAIALNYKSFFAWLTGFFALGMAQVSYNIVTGLAAWVVVTAEVTDAMGFLIILGLLAPALSLALAAGGGLTTFTVIAGGSTGIGVIAVKTIGGAVTSAVNSAVGAATRAAATLL